MRLRRYWQILSRYWQLFKGAPGSLLYKAGELDDLADIICLSELPEGKERAKELRGLAHDFRVEAKRIRGY